MGSKRVIDTYQAITDGDMSSNITGPSTNILYTDRVSYQLIYTGSPTGTFSVQVSNDETTWEDVAFDTTPTASGAGDTDFLEIETGAKFIRLNYTASSGTGTLQAKMTAKSISG